MPADTSGQPVSAPVPHDLYRKRIFEARNGGNYFLVFRPYYRIMSKLDALFIQDLMNLAARDSRAVTGGWFPCPDAVLDSAGWTEKEIEVRFRSLQGHSSNWKKGQEPDRPVWIKIERRGVPSSRWVWIDLDALDTALGRERAPSTEPTSEAISQLRWMPYAEYLQTPHWKAARAHAVKAAQYRCQLCYAKAPLQVHHRTYERRGCELPTDVIALCAACHERHHGIDTKGGDA